MSLVPPQNLKAINSFLKLAKEYDKRDPTIAYFCRMYAVQKGISLDSKSPESKSFLFGLMDHLEVEKGVLIGNGDEAINNDIVAQVSIETHTIELFTWADTEDRNGVFDKKVTKAFYTVSLLFEVLTQFGDQNEECNVMQRYSKWKATYLHRCSQTGETPIPGPEGSGFEDELKGLVNDMSELSNLQRPEDNLPEIPDTPSDIHDNFSKDHSMDYQPRENPGPSTVPQSFSPPPKQVVQLPSSYVPINNVDVEQVNKHLKYTVSALEYEDISSAVNNLTDALNLLTRK